MNRRFAAVEPHPHCHLRDINCPNYADRLTLMRRLGCHSTIYQTTSISNTRRMSLMILTIGPMFSQKQYIKACFAPGVFALSRWRIFFYRWLRAMGWVWVGHEKSRLQQVCCSERNLRCLYILSHFEGLFINICRELKFALQSNVTDRLIATNTIWPIFLFQASLYQMGAFPSWHDLGHIHTSAMSIYIS